MKLSSLVAILVVLPTVFSGPHCPAGSMPDLAPPTSTKEIEKYFEDCDYHMRQFIKERFVVATYLNECDNDSNPVIQPVYYTVGHRVDLRCIVCKLDYQYDGEMKHWQFVPLNKLPGKWHNNDKTWKRDRFFEKIGNVNFFTDLYGWNNEFDNARKATQYFQKDGKLVIVNPGQEAEGFYRCSSLAGINGQKQFAYLLTRNSRIMGTRQSDPIVLEDKWDEKYLSSTLLQNRDEVEKKCRNPNTGENICENFIPSTKPLKDKYSPTFYKPISEPVRMYFGRPIDLQFEFDDKNAWTGLELYVHWSEWSLCDKPEKKVRTRIGRCMLRGIHMSDSFQRAEAYDITFLADGVRTSKSDHGRETDEEPVLSLLFKKMTFEGLRLFSGFLNYVQGGDKMLRNYFVKPFIYGFNEMDKWANKIKDPAKKFIFPSAHWCYHSLFNPEDDGTDEIWRTQQEKYSTYGERRRFNYIGRDMFQNEVCKNETLDKIMEEFAEWERNKGS
ncbi:hypothetical protein L596_022040 [Steinernema carpocapsae]|uniref:Ig-like domain-containing protein n=1 Tax=Steinernema carpocapsae TaxID=34508 RepID=A0A4U5MKM4_STECR|nr:hypothetical protein L596_022040 [Steinernema carpocapsae]